jgi:hypothetical protein
MLRLPGAARAGRTSTDSQPTDLQMRAFSGKVAILIQDGRLLSGRPQGIALPQARALRPLTYPFGAARGPSALIS